MSKDFKELFEPIKIGSMELKNRISMAPMFTKYASESGEVTDKLIEYLVRRAKGGAGLIVVENACIDWATGRGDGNPVAIHHDRFKPRLHDLAKSVQRYGAKIIPEIQHVGRQTFSHHLDIEQPLAPSPIKSEVGGDMPRAMTEEEIEKAIQDFADAARRTKECGFDGVEIHGAHGYLISQFLSPRTNKRTDKWGGSFENRSRFGLAVVKRIRKEVGPNFPLFYRLSVEESTPGSLSLEEGVKYAQLLEEAGVDCLDVTHGTYESIKHFPMQGDPKDQLVYLAEAVKKEVSIPVIAVGSLSFEPEVALDVIKNQKADIVHFGRALLGDPDLPNKIKNNKLEEIRSCIRCNECTGSIDQGHFLSCCVNAECGYEYQDALQPTRDSKRIVVVGAGPAGLEYSITAARCGHQVTLLEKEEQIGGLARVASTTAYKNQELSNMLNYYEVMLKKHGVDLHLGVEGKIENIQEFQPGLVILAMGSKAMELPIPGVEYSEIAINKLLDDGAGLGEKVCIIGGSGVGLDLALFMKEKDKEVTILEMGDTVGRELSGHLRWHLREMVLAEGVEILTEHRVVEITKDSVIASTDGEEVRIECDDVLTAVGFKRLDTEELKAGLAEQDIEVQVLGNMKGAGHFKDAIHAGFWAAVDA
ncbi:NAD(P)/FAD-dependent oxidoreductase [Fuchsiella alkaliacetigena]|uniref:NAD(P)/FAD-dependent oxidoreductase n=1 Tax=Fuchsiella alkaliacetigena TaxID=957042 RepID=UPI00200A62D8|nr:NAD(P)/FAD-dependent oxidoreductase [Fuchsiella alkaliacetigena]MCK8824207.1 NAD(P)/FAD-dependent oxidoreductase [Fuchsiella alkaliacetigena]